MYTLLLSPPPANNAGIVTTGTIVSMVIFALNGIILLVCAKKKRREMVSELQRPVAPPLTFVVGREIVSELREIVSELQGPMAPPPTSVVEREIVSELKEIVSELKGSVAPPPTSVVGREIVLELREIVLELREVVSELQGPVAPPPTSIVGREIDSELREIVSELQGPEAPPPSFVVVQVLEIDVPTMERFLQDMAQEKLIRFTAQQLCSLTTNYSTRLGSGGFGIVYKGQFPNGVKIAVKVLNRSSNKGADEQFMAEVSTIGRTYHINLVRLYGFCHDNFMSALVYEYMENGSLDKYIFSDTQAIKWEKLHEIAIGTAKGIAYMHEECQHRIIHYDIKPGNVLLDANFSPKVADFGLAKICNREKTHDSSAGYRGTPGYSAPEFLLKNYPITYKCDVYSFGMLLFEIIGRRRNVRVSHAAKADESMDWFPKHVWDEFEKGQLEAMILSYGIEENEREKAKRMAMVALWCVQDSPKTRPLMSFVVKMLEGGVEVKPPPKPFLYLFSVGINILNPSNSSNNISNERADTHWYKETTPIMAKYEIEMASSS
ncbi:hypothetical protein CsSME_00049090 [Camellia sinensis var. sinensis]